MKRHLELRLRSEPSEAKRLRAELHEWLLNEGINGATGRDIITAASEAFANAVQHPTNRASNEVTVLGAIETDQLVILEITDDGHWQPTTNPDRSHLGYLLMHATADSVETIKTKHGTKIILKHQAWATASGTE